MLEGLSTTMKARALMYGESSWDEYEAIAHALLAERDRLGGSSTTCSGLAIAGTTQGRAEDWLRLFADNAPHCSSEATSSAPAPRGGTVARALLAGDLEGAERVTEVGSRWARSVNALPLDPRALFALVLLELGRPDKAELILDETRRWASWATG